jgi:hypothetical protein
MFLNLATLKFYCLPDNYEIKGIPSLPWIIDVYFPFYPQAKDVKTEKSWRVRSEIGAIEKIVSS